MLHLLYSGQGGLGTYFMNFVQSDKKKLFKHYAFFYGIEPLYNEYEEFCLSNSIPFTYVKRDSKLDLGSLKLLNGFIKNHSIEFLLLHTFSLMPIVLSKIRKVIAIDHTPYQIKTRREHIFTMLNHIFASEMIYFYPGHFEKVKKQFPFLKFGSHSHIIPKSVDIDLFRPSNDQVENKRFTIGTSSRLIDGKRQEIVIKALSKLKSTGADVHLKIAGLGPRKNELLDLSRSLDLDSNDVTFLGALNRREMVQFYQALDAFVHLSDGETICYCIMEAQSSGLPILASDVEGINNVLHESNAILFRNKVDDVVKAVIELKNNNELQSKLQSASLEMSRQVYERANPSRMLFEILNKKKNDFT
ncbi:MAG: glycosyltransferase [Bacteroidota bacterium]